MHPMTKVRFSWTTNKGKADSIVTIMKHFKTCAIVILEDERLDKITNAHYTVDNKTIKLDYYNTEL